MLAPRHRVRNLGDVELVASGSEAVDFEDAPGDRIRDGPKVGWSHLRGGDRGEAGEDRVDRRWGLG